MSIYIAKPLDPLEDYNWDILKSLYKHFTEDNRQKFTQSIQHMKNDIEIAFEFGGTCAEMLIDAAYEFSQTLKPFPALQKNKKPQYTTGEVDAILEEMRIAVQSRVPIVSFRSKRLFQCSVPLHANHVVTQKTMASRGT